MLYSVVSRMLRVQSDYVCDSTLVQNKGVTTNNQATHPQSMLDSPTSSHKAELPLTYIGTFKGKEETTPQDLNRPFRRGTWPLWDELTKFETWPPGRGWSVFCCAFYLRQTSRRTRKIGQNEGRRGQIPTFPARPLVAREPGLLHLKGHGFRLPTPSAQTWEPLQEQLVGKSIPFLTPNGLRRPVSLPSAASSLSQFLVPASSPRLQVCVGGEGEGWVDGGRGGAWLARGGGLQV